MAAAFAAAQVGAIVLSLPSWTAYAAVLVAGISGAAFGARRGFDVVGVFGLAIATGLGGLLLRDVLLQRGTPVIFRDPEYLLMAVIAATIGFFFAGLVVRVNWAMIVLDGLSLGFLVTVGAYPTLKAGLGSGSAIFIGVLTATGGLVLRDILAGEAPEILRPGVFVGVAALIGAGVFVGLVYQGATVVGSQFVTMAVVLALRVLAEKLQWRTKPPTDFTDRVWGFWHRDWWRRKVAAHGHPAPAPAEPGGPASTGQVPAQAAQRADAPATQPAPPDETQPQPRQPDNPDWFS